MRPSLGRSPSIAGNAAKSAGRKKSGHRRKPADARGGACRAEAAGEISKTRFINNRGKQGGERKAGGGAVAIPLAWPALAVVWIHSTRITSPSPFRCFFAFIIDFFLFGGQFSLLLLLTRTHPLLEQMLLFLIDLFFSASVNFEHRSIVAMARGPGVLVHQLAGWRSGRATPILDSPPPRTRNSFTHVPKFARAFAICSI